MAWTPATDFDAPDYMLNPADLATLIEALRERLTAWHYTLGRDPFNTDFALRYPSGVAPAWPLRSDYQSFYIWRLYHDWLSTLFAAAGNLAFFLPIPGVMKIGADLQGAPVTYLSLPHGVGGLEYLCYQSVGEARTDAGLPDYSAKPLYNAYEAYRVRKPREFANPGDATDTDGNAVSPGHKAWSPDGCLYEYQPGGLWQHIGQSRGDMPDVLDTELAAPFYVKPRAHLSGDYIGGWLLYENRELMKLVRRFTKYLTDSVDGYSGFGSSSNVSYNIARTNAQANYVASLAAVGSPPLSGSAIINKAGRRGNVGGGYDVELTGGAARLTDTINAPFNRAIKIYFGSVSPDPSDYATGYDSAGTVLELFKWKLVQTIASSSAPETVVTDYLMANPPDTPEPGIPPPFPPLDGTWRYFGWEVTSAVWEADYAVAGGFQYT